METYLQLFIAVKRLRSKQERGKNSITYMLRQV